MLGGQDDPWWMALSPALGFLLDALVGGLWRRRPVADGIWRLAARLEVVMRAANGSPRLMGGLHVLWTAAIVGGLVFVLDVAAFGVGRETASFILRSLVFMLLFAVRRLATAGLYVAAAVEADNLPIARQWALALGARIEGDDAAAIVGATVGRVGTGLVSAVLLPLAWGALLGPTAAAAAVAVHELARRGRRLGGENDPFGEIANRVDRGVAEPAAWLGLIALQGALPLVGGNPSGALRYFISRRRLPPDERLAAALACGMGLGGSAGGGADLPSPRAEDLTRVLVVLWLAAALATLVGTAILALLLHA